MGPPPDRPARPLLPPSLSLMIFLGLLVGSVDEREATGEPRREGDGDGTRCELDGCRGPAGGRATMPPDVGDPEPLGDGPPGRGLRIFPLGRGVLCCCDDACAVDEEPALMVDVVDTSTLLEDELFLGGVAALAIAREVGVATMESAGRAARPDEGMRAMRCLRSPVSLL